MKFSRNLMTGMIGLAMLAAPITAAAKDNDSGRNNSHPAQTVSRSNESRPNAPAREAAPAMHNEPRVQHSDRVETRNVAPEMNRHEGDHDRTARVETRPAAPAIAPRTV